PSWLRLDLQQELLFDNKKRVRAGTPAALVENLTRHDHYDPDFNSSFLLTFRVFMSDIELFELLTERFAIQPPEGLTPTDFGEWVAKKQKPVRLRTFNALKTWLESYFYENIFLDQHGNSEPTEFMRMRTQEFLKSALTFGNQLLLQGFATPTTVQNLIEIINKRLDGTTGTLKAFIRTQDNPPPSIISSDVLKLIISRKIVITDINPEELARQFALRNYRLLAAVEPPELMQKAWSLKPNKDGTIRLNSLGIPISQAPHVRRIIKYSNLLTNWLTFLILEQTDVRRRAGVLRYLIVFAEAAYEIHDFSTLMNILSALYGSSIYRLRKTWNQVGSKYCLTIEKLHRLMSPSKNFAQYRKLLHNLSLPSIPFMGVYLTDLTFIEDGNPDVIEMEDPSKGKQVKYINFAKHQKIAEIIREIQQFQANPYEFRPLKEIQHWLDSRRQSVENLNVEQLYEMSLEREPRE
ncbi:hypothetical protein CANCADRAFT_13579, partial [Tortispora caseinolytica NRRL Y-17796]